MLGQSIGPVFGGILTQYCGYRSIFWFLTGFGGLGLLIIVFFLPETLRSIGGDGSVPLKGFYHQPTIYKLTGQPHVNQFSFPNENRVGMKISTVFEPLVFLTEKDVFVTLLFGSVVYTVWSMVTSSTTALFQDMYHLNSLQVGLVFLSNGTVTCSFQFSLISPIGCHVLTI